MTTARDLEHLAAEWLVRRDDTGWTSNDELALAQWLDEDIAHKAAYWRLEHGWRAVDRLGAAKNIAPPVSAKGWSFDRVAALAACLLLALSLAAGGWLLRREAPTVTRIAAAKGVRKEVRLADGSRLTVNTESQLRVAVNHVDRKVWLDRGEAYFQVAHDAGHPFEVIAGDRRITVLGTRFAVRRDGQTVRLTVTEGRVRFENANYESGGEAIVVAGGIAVARGRSLLLADRPPAAIADMLSWRRGVLTFDQTTLSDAVAEFNRYNRRQLRVVDDRAARLRIGGSFDATNADAFARLLHSAFGLEVTESGDTLTISS